MRAKLVPALVLCMLLVVFTPALASAGAKKTTSTIELNLAGGGFLRCTGEMLSVTSGELTVTSRLLRTPSGNEISRTEVDYRDLQIIDAYGNGYSFNSNQEVTDHNVGAHVSKNVWHAALMDSKGNALERYDYTYSVTYNAKGEMTEVRQDSSFTCS